MCEDGYSQIYLFIILTVLSVPCDSLNAVPHYVLLRGLGKGVPNTQCLESQAPRLISEGLRILHKPRIPGSKHGVTLEEVIQLEAIPQGVYPLGCYPM